MGSKSSGRKSKQFIIEELTKCKADPIYFLNNYGRVQHPKRGRIPLHLYTFQEETIVKFHENRFNIVLKSRQLGLSTISAGYAAWLLMFNTSKDVVVIANKREVAQNLLKKVKTFITSCPAWLRPTITIDNRGSLELSNKSKISAHSTTSDSARSESISLLIIDEAAVIDTNVVDDLWTAVFPTLALGGAAIIISTPKGIGNFFHKQWVMANNKETSFNPIQLHWTSHPEYAKDLEYDEKGYPTSTWYEAQKRELADPRKVAQELDCNFLGSGDNFILDEYLRNVEKDVRVPLYMEGDNDSIWVWEEPITGEDYFICADVSRGDGDDYSAAHVIRLSNNTQVAEYRDKVPPDVYAKILTSLGYKYNRAQIACEANNIGYATCLKLVESEYPNIFYSLPSHFNARNRKGLEKNLSDYSRMVPGFQTTSTTRPLVMSHLEEAVRTQKAVIYSSRLLSELRTLIWIKGKPQATSGYNDDLAVAFGIGQLIISTMLKDIVRSNERTFAMMSMFGHRVNEEGHPNLETTGWVKNSDKSDPWILNINGQREDLRWLVN